MVNKKQRYAGKSEPSVSDVKTEWRHRESDPDLHRVRVTSYH